MYRLLLYCFPRAFRRRFGDDMAAVFEDRRRAAWRRGMPAATAFWWRTAIDAIAHGLSERRHARRLASGRPDTRKDHSMSSRLLQDVRYAVRSLAAQPLLAATAVATLALGIGAGTAVFSVADALLLKAMPYPSADRIVALTDDNEERGISVNVALPNFDDWRSSVDAIESAAAWQTGDVNLVGPEGAERLKGAVVAGDFFDVTGATPLAGRLFDDDPGLGPEPAPVAVISERAATRLFGGRGASGGTLVMDGTPHTVIGVVPAVAGLDDVDVWRPVTRTGSAASRRSHGYVALARLRPDVTLDAARAELDAVAARLARAYPESNEGWRVGAVPLRETLTADVDQVLFLLAGAAALLLVTACTNVASLLTSRATGRRREFAVRRALGASRARLVSQVLTESVLVSLAGAGAGLMVAWWSAGALGALMPIDLAAWRQPGLSPTVLAFAAATAVVTGVLFGLAPAVPVVRSADGHGLRDGARTTPAGIQRLRQSLVVVQVTLACVLLVVSGLLGSSLWRAMRVDPGFDPSATLTFRVTPPASTHADDDALRLYYDRLLTRLAAMPQVEAAAAISSLPLGDDDTIATVRLPDEPPAAIDDARWVLQQVASPRYLAASGTRLIAGRDFTAADATGAPPVAIVNETLARQLWPGQSPIGREVMLEPDPDRPHRVIGLIADVRHLGLDREAPYPQYFVPIAQAPVRAASVALRLQDRLTADVLRTAVAEVDATVPPFAIRTMHEVASGSLAGRRDLAATVVGFGLAATALAAIGLTALVAVGVRERRREIGIRVALGATDSGIVRLFVRRAATTAAAGILAGLVGSYWITTFVADFLFGVDPLDGPTFGMAAALLFAVSVTAAWLPSRRAARVDPVRVLNAE